MAMHLTPLKMCALDGILVSGNRFLLCPGMSLHETGRQFLLLAVSQVRDQRSVAVRFYKLLILNDLM